MMTTNDILQYHKIGNGLLLHEAHAFRDVDNHQFTPNRIRNDSVHPHHNSSRNDKCSVALQAYL